MNRDVCTPTPFFVARPNSLQLRASFLCAIQPTTFYYRMYTAPV